MWLTVRSVAIAGAVIGGLMCLARAQAGPAAEDSKGKAEVAGNSGASDVPAANGRPASATSLAAPGARPLPTCSNTPPYTSRPCLPAKPKRSAIPAGHKAGGYFRGSDAAAAQA